MKNIPVQADNLTSLAAADFNEVPRESENAIQASGQTLTSSDLQQIAKALAIYSGCGDAYTDSGYSNVYVLSPSKVNIVPPNYYLGMRIRFKPLFANTATACTVNVSGIGAVSIHVGQRANGAPPVVPVGRILANKIYTMIFDVTQDGLTNYFRMDQVSDEMVESVSLDKLIAGETDITVSNDRLRLNAEYMNFNDTSTGASMTIKSGSGADNAFSYSPSVGGRRTTIEADGLNIQEPTGGTYRPTISISGDGVSYNDGPGSSDVVTRRWDGYDASSITWAVDPNTSRIYYSGNNLLLTGIPWGAKIYGVFIGHSASAARDAISPLSCQLINSGGTTQIDDLILLGSLDPDAGTDQIIWVAWDASSIT